ncbi:hypothetical protein F4V43_02125 [Paenibacillus spiritus]|uniref:3D domain-containing protein n=1 Tax=Paenibacillus spiritus TaxID=2496557 RepID=A0A5J5GGG9_9BACL|nr:3D domain-containing protein [Paenibacillus spiritus]KAA9007306.1 hypothetical protein F4V43_02125 [Paenibacillus spiritus]
MLKGAILSLLLFAQPTIDFTHTLNVSVVEELKNTNNTYKSQVAKKVEFRTNFISKAEDHDEKVKPQRKNQEDREEWMLFEISAYTNGKESTGKTPGDKGYALTASGVRTKEGRTVSADTKVLPIGTIIYIDNIGERRVEDTGSAIKGRKLDLFIEDLKEARKFGRKKGVKVKIIKMGSGELN